MKDALIMPAGAGEVIDRAPGVRTWPLVTAARGATEFLTGITEFDSGASLQFHFHNCQESIVILQGVADFETSQSRSVLHESDATLVPAGLVHRFLNRGPERLRILFIYGSMQVTRTIVDL